MRRATSTVVEIAAAGGIGVGLREFLSDGIGVVFADERDVGNDLYIGRPDQAAPVELLLDVSEEDELVDIVLSPDQSTAFVSLVSTDVTFIGVADRILSIPLTGGPVKTLIDLRKDPAGSLVVSGATTGPYVTEATLVYVRADPSGQAGFYLLDLSATGIAGDYNDDGTLDAADYVLWRKNEGTTNPLPNDPIGGTIRQAQYDQWAGQFGQTRGSGSLAGSTVPEPASVPLIMLAAIAVSCSVREVCRSCRQPLNRD
jgi:hypothetical protein